MSPATDHDEDLRGVVDPDFLALGLGGTNMMSMLWAVAMGRRAVGIDMRGDPFLGVHWNIRADLFHQLGLIDELMSKRYGEHRIPRRGQSDKPFRLAETLYSPATKAGDIVADEIIDAFDMEQHIAGTIHHVEFIDDRWRDGMPTRTVTLLTPPQPPAAPDPNLIRTNMREVLDGPSTFQAGAASVLVLLRRYLERMEQMDLEAGLEPRLRLFTRHRVMNTPEGFVRTTDGRLGFRIEALQELNYRGKFVRIRRPGSRIIEIGVPALFMIAEGFHSTDAERLGFAQEDAVVDHQDGRGPVVAQADFLAGLIEVLVGGRLRRRISSEFDEHGNEYWVRQIAVGHENDPEVGWCLVQVPDFKSFDPIKAGLVPEGTDVDSPEYFAAYETLVYDFYVEHVADILDMPAEQLRKIQMVYGPKLFTLIERLGADPLVAPNGVVAGDSFGNGHFLTSGGAMTGMIGHSWRVYEYFQALDAGTPQKAAIRMLADRIREDTEGWLHVSAKEYSEAIPINFGAERIAQIEARGGIASSARAAAIDASRRQRHALLPLDPSDWRRLFLRNGKVHSAPLPELHAMHPALRRRQARKKRARVTGVFVADALGPATLRFLEGALGQPGATLGLVTNGSAGHPPESLRERLAAFIQVEEPRDPQQIVDAVRGMEGKLGPPERLLGTTDEIQLALAEAREALGIEGMRPATARDFGDMSRLRRKLAEAGLPLARYARIESVEDGMAFGTELGYYPILVRPNERTGTEAQYRVDTEDELRSLLERLRPRPERPWIAEEFIGAAERGLEVISLGGLPAWFSAMRFAPDLLDAKDGMAIVLPREPDDPADAIVRRMGFAALKALGMETGISSMRWCPRPDGTPVIIDVAAGPPIRPILQLIQLAHGIDIYRLWGNIVVNGQFAPIPRSQAAGGIWFGTAGGATRIRPDEIARELGGLAVDIEEPPKGVPRSTVPGENGCILVRHAETAVVDAALRRILASAERRLDTPAPANVG